MRVSGEKLKRQRQNKGISQQLLSEGVGLSQGMVSMLENGIRNIRMSTLSTICLFIGCDVESVTENGEPDEYTQIMRNIKQLSDSQLEIVSNIIREFLKKNNHTTSTCSETDNAW